MGSTDITRIVAKNATGQLTLRRAQVNQIVRQVVKQVLEPAAEDIAAKSNAEAGISDGYRAGTEGSGERLKKRAYRATVITATAEAIRDNEAHNRLINNLNVRF